uniref:Proline dehydrogenase n=1 Tax=Rhizochromulina marina TaxID=1034831 RepID=A0A7S2ST57_9STRA|mmetsp:Transcript_7027/g.20306  ORF Transcript_7027/g.20306 Transcript_7027/m.20306 type:complete len:592 (+) Transcript_7027:270-2045(+)
MTVMRAMRAGALRRGVALYGFVPPRRGASLHPQTTGTDVRAAAATARGPAMASPAPDAPPRTQHATAGPLDLSDTASVYARTSTGDLVRALVVLCACQIKPLVQHADWLLSMAQRVFGGGLVDFVLKHSFYAHFCAGEDEKAIRPRIEALQGHGVGSILDYAAEADEHASPQRSQSPIQVDVARKYHYEGEAACDAHVDVFLRCIETVHGVSPGGFAAIKLTALGPPALLKRMSTAIEEVRTLFHKFDATSDGVLTTDEFINGYRKFFVETRLGDAFDDQFGLEGLLHSLDPHKTGHIDYVEWSNQLQLEHLPVLTRRCRGTGPLSESVLQDWEMQALVDMSKRIDVLACRASDLGVRLMVDAEQTYFQPAIDNTVFGLQEKYNARTLPSGDPGKITVFNTYQLYLKDAMARLVDDLRRAERKGYFFGAKLVRGAYMVSERQRAEDLGYPSPIHDTLEDTHAAYDEAIKILLDSIAGGEATEFMVASHNQDSVQATLGHMHDLGLPPGCGVHFGQLLGMADHVTFSLGAEGHDVHKYVPYGHVGEVVPYLLRRAQENSAVLGTATTEIGMMQTEIARRFSSGFGTGMAPSR